MVWAKSPCTTENSLLTDFMVWFRRVLWVFRIVIVPFRDFPKVCRAWLWTRSCCRISGISAWISPTCRLTVARLTALAVFMPMLNRVPTAAAAPNRAPKNSLEHLVWFVYIRWLLRLCFGACGSLLLRDVTGKLSLAIGGLCSVLERGSCCCWFCSVTALRSLGFFWMVRREIRVQLPDCQQAAS